MSTTALVIMSNEQRAALASLIDVVDEVVCGLASGDMPSKGYAYTVVESLNEHARILDIEPTLRPEQIKDWEGVT